MNVERINDYLDAYSKAINLTPEITSILKELIPKLVQKYSKDIASISVEQDGYEKYVIKPVDGKYSVEDFFLNRLFRNVWEVYSSPESDDKGHFEQNYMEIGLNMPAIEKQLSSGVSSSREDFAELDAIARKKVIMHEFEHALQTQYSGDVLWDNRYKKIFEEIRRIKGGKYQAETNEYSESVFTHDYGMQETYTHVGLYCSEKNTGMETYRSVTGFNNLNEIFNETEALDVAGAKIQGGRQYENNTYYRVRNVESSNWRITNYGVLLKTLLGGRKTFEGMYLNPERMFRSFNEAYNQIFQEYYGNENSAWENLINQINKIKTEDSLEEHLKLDTLLTKCLEKKLESTVQKGKATPETLRKINSAITIFENNTIESQDESVRDGLEHVQILKSMRERVKQLEGNTYGRMEQQRNKQEEKNTQTKKKIEEGAEEKEKMSFINGLIQAYNNTETEYQYEVRATHENADIQRVQNIISTNGLNIMMMADLKGKMIETSQKGNFKFEYSQKQVSAMARLLKAAKLLTDNKKLNPTGKNYLQEFCSIPNIEQTLLQMKNGFKDKDSYIFKLREESRNNRFSGKLPNFPKTQGEIDAASSSTTRDSAGQMVEQPMELTDKQIKEKEQENLKRRDEEETKRKVNEDEKINSKEESSKKVTINAIDGCIRKSSVTYTEVGNAENEIKERKHLSDLSLKFRMLHNLNEEEQQTLNVLRAKYEKPTEVHEQIRNKGMER